MKSLSLALLAAQALSAFAVDIKVKGSGGNATSGTQYGFLHEVRAFCHMVRSKSTKCKTYTHI